ncbi:hypothetical protein [Salinarimonas sp.]|uniref:hypothetical protein n=1 Tax=Salinarimonas sp. TaxID=2766526 RepID=UPI0032D8E27B
MRGTPITGAARGVSITDTVDRAQRILQDRPEPQGRDRYANRTNRPPKNGAKAASGDDAREEPTGTDSDAQAPAEGDAATTTRPAQ